MARVASPFYYSGDEQLGQTLGATLGRALFGDPEAAAQLALRKAQADTYAANAEESRAHAGLYGSQTQGVDIQNHAAEGLPGLIASMFQHAPAAPAAAAPAAPVDPLAPLPDAPAAASYGPGFDMDTMRAGLPAAIAAMAQMQGDKVDPRQVMGSLAAFMGGDELARRGMAAQGQSPSKDFAITPERADDIAQQGYDADYKKSTQVATINHANDLAVARENHASDIPVARINHENDIPVANINASAKRDVAGMKNEVGFSLVTDVLPGARLTGPRAGERDTEQNKAVGGADHSYHLPGDGVEAFDIVPGTGARTFADAKAAMQAKYGSRLVEAIDETHRPGHGPHWHFAVADAPGAKAGKAGKPAQVSTADVKMIAGLIKQQAGAAGLNLDPGAFQNMQTSAVKLFQKSGNPTDAVNQVFVALKRNMAARKGGGDTGKLRQDALAAIGQGADPAKVKARFKSMTGQDLKGV
jgi:hypothetical protein